MNPEKAAEAMKKLQEHIGKVIIVTYISYGETARATAHLKQFFPFWAIRIDPLTLEEAGIIQAYDPQDFSYNQIPFFSDSGSIQKIMTQEGEILYENTLITEKYSTDIFLGDPDVPVWDKKGRFDHDASDQCCFRIHCLLFGHDNVMNSKQEHYPI